MGRKKNLDNYFRCEKCNEYTKKRRGPQQFCLPCANKKTYIPVNNADKTCENCKLTYPPVNKRQRFCNETCRRQFEINEANKAWCEKVEKPKMRQDSNKVAYSFFRIKRNQGWLNNFKVWRG